MRNRANVREHLDINLYPAPIVYYYIVCPSPELKEAVEDVLPSLTGHGVTILLMTKHCDTPGIDSFSDKVEEAPDTALPRSLRSHLTFKSPAVYIYTSGTTGIGMLEFCILWVSGKILSTFLSLLHVFFQVHDVLFVTRCLSGLPKAAVVNQNRLLTALAVLASNGVSASDIIYLNLPLYHTAGFIIGFIGSIETGEPQT